MQPLNLPFPPISDRLSMSGNEGWLPPNTRRTYCELDGPGCIRHIWMTISRSEFSNRKCILRIYFDGSEVPHVEAPLGDFFGVMHGEKWYPVNTKFLSVQAETGYNCYFAMPFAKSARLELESGDEGLPVYLMVNWHRYPGAELQETRRFCARWRRECPTQRYGRDFLALDADGPGQLLGFVYGVRLLDDTDRWSHGGADNFYGDGETDTPFYLRGVGGEDTFGTSYGGAKHPPETHLHAGMPYYVHEDVGEARVAQRVVGYRFFDTDELHFRRSLHFRFGCMANDICATTYWYQEETPRTFWSMAPFPQLLPGAQVTNGEHDLPLTDAGQWWLCGPFASQDSSAEMALPAESGPIDPEQTFAGGHTENSPYLAERAVQLGRDRARWVRADSLRGFIDFNHYFRCGARGVAITHPAVAVARTTVVARRACNARITLSWDDCATLRVNEAEPMELGHHVFFRSASVEVALTEGINEIVVTLTNTYGLNHGGWAFAFHCITEDGDKLLPQIHVSG